MEHLFAGKTGERSPIGVRCRTLPTPMQQRDAEQVAGS